MSRLTGSDEGRRQSGRQPRVPSYKSVHEHDLRANDSVKIPELDTFLEWLKSSYLSPVPVRTFDEVLEKPEELAVIQERVSSLSPEDEKNLRELQSLDELPQTWREGVKLSNSDDFSSRVHAGAKPPGAVQVLKGLSRSEIVEERLGDTILVEKSSFSAFHVDVRQAGHSFSTLLTGRKLWMFCLPSAVGKELDRLGRTRRSSFSETIEFLQSLSKVRARQISWVLLEPDCTVYFPYLFLHSVWTDVQPGTVRVMYSCERSVSEGWRLEQMRRADSYLALSVARGKEFGGEDSE